MPAVSVKGVSKNYRLFQSARDRLKETLSLGRKKYGRDFCALEGIDLEVEPGAALAILGRNGAGKSTLLRIISGLLQPTSGTVEVNGRLIALSGTGAGFNDEFTGRENVMLNGMLLGMSRQEILERFDEIAAFADIGEFMDQPLRTYSSGMRSRLGMAVAINVEPDILILDETLAPGDPVYANEATQRMYQLRDSGTAILLVSHKMKTVEDFCKEAILLHKGRKIAAGETTEVINQYQALTSSIQAQRKNPGTGGGQGPDGNVVPDEEGGARIQSVELLDEQFYPIDTVPPTVPHASTVTVRVNLEYLEAVKDSAVRIVLRNETKKLKVFSTSTDTLEGVPLKKVEKGEQVMVDFTVKVPLQDGLYSVTVGAYAGSEEPFLLDRVKAAIAFNIAPPQGESLFQGIVRLPTEVKVHAPAGERQGRSV
jgi:ABC-type polysaccharide/polyol phosphate transport system ATPase subunit